MSFFAKLAVLISANTSEFKAGLDDATKSTKKFEAEQRRAMREAAKATRELEAALRTAGQVAAVAAVAIGGALKYADEIADTADAFDITIESLLGMQQALTLAGGKADNFGTMLQKLSNQAQAAADGTDKAREAFDKLGISGKEVEQSAPDELFARVARSLSQIEDPIKRNALAFEVLGKAAKGVDWKNYWEDYASGKTTTEGVSEAIKEGATAWDNLGKAGKAALQGILVLIRPLTAFINFMAEKIQEGQQKPMTGSLFDAEFGGAFDMQGYDMATGGTKPPAAAKAAQEKKGGDYSKLSDKQQGFAAATEAVKQQTDEIMRQVGVMIEREELQSRLLKMSSQQREIEIQLLKIEEEKNKLIADAQKEIAIESAKGEGKVNQEKIQALLRQIEVIKFAKETEKSAITEIITLRQQEQMTFEAGWERAFNKFKENAADASKLGEMAFNSFTTNMERALEEFVRTGKLSFKDLAGSIIKDLIRIRLQAQLSGLFDMLLGSFGFGSRSTPAPISDISIFGGAADGGFIDGPTLVGEQGPELFIPRSPGVVVPNQQMGNFMGGNNYVTNNYINAIDTKSFEDRILGSANAVWAANQYAGKSLAVGRGRA